MSKKIATSITNISKVDLLSYILSLIGAGLFTLFIIGSFLPFAQSTTLEKVIIFFLGMIAGFIIFRIIWLKVLIPNIQEIKNHWVFHSIIAFVFTFFVISLTLYTPPLSPIELQFTIQTSQPFAFSHSFMEESFGKRFILDSADYRFEGEWKHSNKVSEHIGYEKGTIRYSSSYISTGFFIDFVFPTLEIPSSASIIINGIDYSVDIPDSTTAGKTFIFRTENMVLPSYSTYYRILSTIHPYARGILLYYLFFSGSVFIRSHTKKPLELILHYSLFWIFSYLFFISLNFQDINFNILNHNVFLLFMVTMAFVAIPIGIMSLLKKHPRSETWLLLLILVIALGVRLYWVQMVPTGQVSDFGRFHYRALQLAEGEPGLFIDKYSVFTRLLSLVYRIAPSADLVIGINIFLSLLSIFCLYWIGKEIGYPVAGVLAGYFFSIFPSEISMVGIVCTDIPSATILLLIAALLIRYFKSPKWYWLAGAGLLFAIIFRIRAHMLMYFPIFLVPLFFSKFHSWKKIVQYGATFLISFFLGITMINGIVNQISVEGMEIEESKNIILPLVNGTNIAAKGRISNADIDLVESWTPDEAWNNGIHLVIRRVFTNPFTYYNLLKTKFDHVFANGAYGADLAFIDERMDYSVFKTEWQHPTQDVRNMYSLISQYAYWCILGYALLFAFLRADKLKVIGWIIFTLLYSAFGTYIFFEVQPRYQRPVIPFILLAAALALSVCQGPVRQRGFRKDQQLNNF